MKQSPTGNMKALELAILFDMNEERREPLFTATAYGRHSATFPPHLFSMNEWQIALASTFFGTTGKLA